MPETSRSHNPLIINLSILVLSGTVLGRTGIPWWIFLCIGSTTCLCSLLVPQFHWRITTSLGFMLVLSTWSAIGNQMLRDDDLMLLTGYGNVPVLVHLEGRIIEISGTRLDLETRSSVQDADTPVHGRIVVRLPEANRMLDRGDLISVKGWLHGIDHHESGEPDWRSIAVNGDYRGWMRLESNDLIEIVSIHEPLPWDSIKSYARDRLLSQPVPAWGVERTLLAGLLLGARRSGTRCQSVPEDRDIPSACHLGSPCEPRAAPGHALIRIGGGHRRWHSFAAMFFLAIYLSIIETRTPVIRAAIMSSFLYPIHLRQANSSQGCSGLHDVVTSCGGSKTHLPHLVPAEFRCCDCSGIPLSTCGETFLPPCKFPRIELAQSGNEADSICPRRIDGGMVDIASDHNPLLWPAVVRSGADDDDHDTLDLHHPSHSISETRARLDRNGRSGVRSSHDQPDTFA